MDLFEKLQELRDQGLSEIDKAKTEEKLNDVRVKLVGRKSELTEILHSMKDVEPEKRREIGQKVNKVRDLFNQKLDDAKNEIVEKLVKEQLEKEAIDVTLPGREEHLGTKHPINIILDDLEKYFIGMGFKVAQGPEIETDHYCFEMMNLPKDHPARDMQETFYIDSEDLLRSQTSGDQARELEKHDFSKGPLKMVGPGKVYRRDDDDATHSHQFMQMEGLVVDKNITMGDLKGTLELMAKHVFGQDRETRLRPSYFPFTEPSVEMDVSCFNCNGKGCSICKYTGWIEVLGAGMVHPNVLENAGVDSNVYGGFAFGVGLDRFAILKYGIDDIRDFYTNDVRFLEQFSKEER
ncbi:MULTISPECIES: phenylalanine--tRNA ligase subunit alpha [Lactobacillus]|uniref:Phenylalanine--tRNA ligase alpha subunit n=1 Tax=Lactobacillus apis TaxID=303541 RepID=A0A0F4LVR1_9LACO|nr:MULTISPECIES: phenylalanine--tRNA ligase subunit alpha [Lactobacillus]AWM74469.1 phenylalanine--tRNA ligase subunit alpha [Lactobacillus apis]KJY61611.1 Phenylalanine--tRNA ligase alpha subunit [Lactobacillus apis]MBC6361155.1 phenylalanine--tRNA ligase subunit alpha [Lactobacillus apis]MBH9985653.1 phenylalanine--tRNA ligase subunit alpha [Lactobacillus sp. M0390]MBI0092669.1 phenylalanine--tRNA ligase subunit alpha [Lactobacillus sp. M0403]